ncbi:unnamed protein product [Schistosoma curassoni]|uniref:Mon2_C domain-containing protein n=1 Tax=Schistosoma curassoni TaxID=6186 RepID=A0A183L518_9TREM|nr:unnamed protein product [Schistosoma curassoni]
MKTEYICIILTNPEPCNPPCPTIGHILFPLLSKVHNLYQSAPVEKVGDRPNSLLIHHSRDTASKQWAETVVLTLTGVSHCFISKQSHLLTLSKFSVFFGFFSFLFVY